MINKISKTFIFVVFLSIFLTTNLFAQKTKDSSDQKSLVIPKVIKVDDVSIKEVLKPKGKPLFVNFWATWCVPCREEFPELVELAHKYKGKIDLITISLDDLAEINRDVPKFLKEMKATMPAYLLKTNDENAVISSISKDWGGGLPFSVLYNEKGEVVYTKQGKIKPPIVKEKINSLISDNSKTSESSKTKNKNDYEKGIEDAKKDISKDLFIIKISGDSLYTEYLKKTLLELTNKHNVQIKAYGCLIGESLREYLNGYNRNSISEINRRFKLNYDTKENLKILLKYYSK